MLQTRLCPHFGRWLTVVGVSVLLVLILASTAGAQETDNEFCLGCHSSPGLRVELASGEVLPLTVDPEVYNNSVHGTNNVACVSCHTNISGYPHPPLTAGDIRSFELERYTECQTCHPQQYDEMLDSNHARALAAGNRNAAICSDCHGAHEIHSMAENGVSISQSCEQCHSVIYEQYAGSVHASALTGNPDTPTCTDCHGAHTQADPTTARFRVESPQLCAGCHADTELMAKYGISTYVFDTYLQDFHGTTVALFERLSPDVPPTEAVCTDCHGVHDIMHVTSENASVVKQNLLDTCQKCHPDATANFPDSWVGHFPPSPTNNPLVFYVNLFYNILIPVALGGMALWVILDAARRIKDRSRSKESGTHV